MLQTDKYEDALRSINRLWAGEDRRKFWTTLPSSGMTPQSVGIDKQKAAYNAWAAKSGAYPK